jgi:AAA+ superfamily predicted ATPase
MEESDLNLNLLGKNAQKSELEVQQDEVNMAAVDNIIAYSPQALKDVIRAYEHENRDMFSDQLPRSILLLGDPGVGKSTLARGIAIKAKLPYHFIECSLIGNEYKNSGTKNLERIFDPILKSNRQEAVILDEINALTDKHGNEHDADKNMATALWQIMDRIKNKKKFTPIIATANSNDKMPEPLKDRFATTMFSISLPDKKMRASIAQYYLGQAQVAYKQSILSHIAGKTNYSSGRFIEDACKKIIFNAKLRILNTNNTLTITKADVDKAFVDINSSLQVGGYVKHSEAYKRIKKIGAVIAPYILPSIGLFLQVYSLHKQSLQSTENLDVAKKGLALSEKGFKLSKKSLDVSKQSADISQKSYENQPHKASSYIATGTGVVSLVVTVGKIMYDTNGNCTIQ